MRACVCIYVCVCHTYHRSMSRGRSLSLADPKANSGIKDSTMRNKAIKMADKSQRIRNKMAKV